MHVTFVQADSAEFVWIMQSNTWAFENVLLEEASHSLAHRRGVLFLCLLVESDTVAEGLVAAMCRRHNGDHVLGDAEAKNRFQKLKPHQGTACTRTNQAMHACLRSNCAPRTEPS